MNGKVITIEGGDRVGKHTQSVLLSQYLYSIGIDTITLSFPNYILHPLLPFVKPYNRLIRQTLPIFLSTL